MCSASRTNRAYLLGVTVIMWKRAVGFLAIIGVLALTAACGGGGGGNANATRTAAAARTSAATRTVAGTPAATRTAAGTPAATRTAAGTPAVTRSPAATGTAVGTAAAGTKLTIAAKNTTFDKSTLRAAAGTVTITFDNQDSGVTHNLRLFRGTSASGTSVGATPLTSGPDTQTLTVNLTPGTYYYQCDAHPTTMSGTLTVS